MNLSLSRCEQQGWISLFDLERSLHVEQGHWKFVTTYLRQIVQRPSKS